MAFDEGPCGSDLGKPPAGEDESRPCKCDLEGSGADGLGVAVGRQSGRRAAQEHAEAYFTEEGRASVETILARHELTQDAIAAQAMAIRLPELDIIDRQMERA